MKIDTIKFVRFGANTQIQIKRHFKFIVGKKVHHEVLVQTDAPRHYLMHEVIDLVALEKNYNPLIHELTNRQAEEVGEDLYELKFTTRKK